MSNGSVPLYSGTKNGDAAQSDSCALVRLDVDVLSSFHWRTAGEVEEFMSGERTLVITLRCLIQVRVQKAKILGQSLM